MHRRRRGDGGRGGDDALNFLRRLFGPPPLPDPGPLGDLIERVRVADVGLRITGGVGPRPIRALEDVTKWPLPHDYHDFLRLYGTLGFAGLELYGLIEGADSVPGPPDTLSMTRAEIESEAIPGAFVMLHSTGYGPVHLLDCVSEEVVSWDYSGSSTIEYDCFTSFAMAQIERTLADTANSG